MPDILTSRIAQWRKKAEQLRTGAITLLSIDFKNKALDYDGLALLVRQCADELEADRSTLRAQLEQLAKYAPRFGVGLVYEGMNVNPLGAFVKLADVFALLTPTEPTVAEKTGDKL